MTARLPHARWLFALLVLAGVGIAIRLSAGRAPGAAEEPAPQADAPPATLLPAANLRVQAATHAGAAADLLDPAAAGWEAAVPTRVLLNRTPRVYPTEPVEKRPPPGLEVKALRATGGLAVRLRWDDPTRDAPEAPTRKSGEGGDPDKLYKRPTTATSQFADAAAVMVPRRWTGPAFPSLQMGDKASPVALYYWNASRGAEVLTSAGRTTPAPSGDTFPCRAAHEAGGWVLTAVLPDPPDGYPVAFAVWDGGHQDRDGLKWFSIWYVLTPAAGAGGDKEE